MSDITNADRAGWALEALYGFVKVSKVKTARDAVADLVTDLFHLAHGRGLDVHLLARHAAGAMAEELAEDPEGDMARVQNCFLELFPEDS